MAKSKALSISVEEKKWRTESDLSTLQRAKEIMADKSRMSAVQSLAKQQLSALSTIVQKNASKPAQSTPVRKLKK
jgi:hypothetical protein